MVGDDPATPHASSGRNSAGGGGQLGACPQECSNFFAARQAGESVVETCTPFCNDAENSEICAGGGLTFGTCEDTYDGCAAYCKWVLPAYCNPKDHCKYPECPCP